MVPEQISQFREKLRQLERRLGWVQRNDVQCCGISIAQCHALVEIGKKREISLVELAGILGLDTSTMSRNIDNMVKAGLVHRVVNPEDRRYILITLTEHGNKTFQMIEESNDAFISKFFTRIPVEKHRQIIESFELVIEAMRDCNSNDCCNNGSSKNKRDEGNE